jgi:hypothetical protein
LNQYLVRKKKSIGFWVRVFRCALSGAMGGGEEYVGERAKRLDVLQPADHTLAVLVSASA